MGARITPLWLSCVAGLCFLCAAAFGAVEIGTERILVVHELGNPTSSVARGDTEVLTYPGGVRITLKAGRVSKMVGLKPSEPAAEGMASPVEKPAEEPAEPALTKEQAAELDRLEKLQGEEQAKAQAQMEKALADLENLHDNPPATLPPPRFDIVSFLVELVVKWLLMLAALKLTCKYWAVEVFWSGLMIVALVDVLVRSSLDLVGQLLLEMPSLFYADEAIAAVAMVVVLRKVSINRSLAQAVQITMTSKVFSIVVGSFLITVLLQALH